jgi:hypothetical protein
MVKVALGPSCVTSTFQFTGLKTCACVKDDIKIESKRKVDLNQELRFIDRLAIKMRSKNNSKSTSQKFIVLYYCNPTYKIALFCSKYGLLLIAILLFPASF